KLLFAGILVACAAGGFRLGLVWATPSQGFTSTSLVGPVTLDEFDTMAEADYWKVRLKTKGLSDVYVTDIQIVPGGTGGWCGPPPPVRNTHQSAATTALV